MDTKRKAGRPTLYGVKLKARTVKLDDATVERAQLLGDGNLSEGIRRAIAQANPAPSADAHPAPPSADATP